MSTVLIRDAKLSDAPRLLEIYSYYVKNTAITFEYKCRRSKNSDIA